MKLKKILFMTAVFSFAMAGTAFAGTWKNGNGENQNRWWYDFDNGTYAANGWYWIDGNNDGVAECYYFDGNGWMLENTTTPDGYTVNANGVWTVDGVVQVQSAAGTDNKANAGSSSIVGTNGQGDVNVPSKSTFPAGSPFDPSTQILIVDGKEVLSDDFIMAAYQIDRMSYVPADYLNRAQVLFALKVLNTEAEVVEFLEIMRDMYFIENNIQI